jgi:hypothetical protein
MMIGSINGNTVCFDFESVRLIGRCMCMWCYSRVVERATKLVFPSCLVDLGARGDGLLGEHGKFP